jgi:methionine-rich copper-binding protein CopC
VKAAAFALFTLTLLAAAPPAQAQVRCLSSFPPPDGRLEAAPGSVLLWMSEPVDPQRSWFQVTDPYGRTFHRAPRVSADGLRVEIPLEPLPEGVFVVHYRAASVLNGHVSVGLFRFGVRRPVPRPDSSVAAAVLRAAGALFTVGAVASGSALGAWAAAATALVEWVYAAEATVPAPLPVLVREGWAGLVLAGTRPGWAALLALATAGAWAVPSRPPRTLLRTVAVVWLLLVVPLLAAAGGPLSLLASSHAAALVLMVAAYGVVGVLAALALPVLGVRVEEPGWIPPLLGVLLAAAWALRPAGSVQEFFALWAAVGSGCAAAYLWGRARREQAR